MNRKDIIEFYNNSDIEQPPPSPINKSFLPRNVGVIALIVFVHLVGVGCVIGLTPTTKELFARELFSKKEQVVVEEKIQEQPLQAQATPIPKPTVAPTPAPQQPQPVPNKENVSPPANIASVPAPAIQQPIKPIVTKNEKGLITSYVVQRGDTVSKIAKRFRLSSKRLVELNKIKDPNKLQVGQTLRFM